MEVDGSQPVSAPSSAVKRPLSPDLRGADNIKRSRFNDSDSEHYRENGHCDDDDKENDGAPRGLHDSHPATAEVQTPPAEDREPRSLEVDSQSNVGHEATSPELDAPATADPPSTTDRADKEEALPVKEHTDRPGRRGPRAIDDRTRGKRLFGSLLGTLAKANSSADPAIQRRRADIERKQQLRVRHQAREDDSRRHDQIRKLQRIRRREHWDFEERVITAKHEQLLVTAKFLQTKTEPKIFFCPKVLLPVEEDMIDDQLDDAHDQIESETDEFERRRAAAAARSLRSNPARDRDRNNDRDRGRDRDLVRDRGFGFNPDFGRPGGRPGRGRNPRRGPDLWTRSRDRDIDYTAGGRASPSRSRSRTRSRTRSPVRADRFGRPQPDLYPPPRPDVGVDDSMDVDMADDVPPARRWSYGRTHRPEVPPLPLPSPPPRSVSHMSVDSERDRERHRHRDRPDEPDLLDGDRGDGMDEHKVSVGDPSVVEPAPGPEHPVGDLGGGDNMRDDTVIEGEEDTVIY